MAFNQRFPKLQEIADQIGEIDVIIGGPPCQGFSLSGKRDVNDPRNTLFRHYLRFVDKFRPKMALLENVRLLTSMKNENGGWVRDDILNEFEEHGYEIQLLKINAKGYGVPQHRERVLFVAVSKECDFRPSLPTVTFGLGSDLFGGGAPHRTFADACSDLEYLESGEQSESDGHHFAVKHPAHVIEWLWNVPQGASAHENEDVNLRPPSGYNTTYKRQIWNEPASTVQTTFGMISGCRNVHPIATRSLTIREAARIQSFPDSYKFVGTSGTIRTGIGNAVPPLLSYALGQHVKKVLKSCKSNQLLGRR
jgi:DNA (cytosine-5)-methyltransferase 1